MRLYKPTILLLLLLTLPITLPAQEKAAQKPDMLFIFVDDLAYDCVGYAGNPVVKTPNLDRLAKRSTSFVNSYNMGSWSGAVCQASRAMLNSGRFVWQAKPLSFVEEAKAGRMWSQQFKKAGYQTWMTGKWHVHKKAVSWNSLDPLNCFDTRGIYRDGMPKVTPRSHPHAYKRPEGPEDKKWVPWKKEEGGYWKGGKHWSEVTADEGIAFLEKNKENTKPLFMYLAFNAPHDPRQAPKEFHDMYPPEKVDLPAGFQPIYPHYKSIGCVPNLRDEALAPFPRTEYSIKVNRGEYYALISHLDQQIGRVLDTLEKTGKADNTIIVFTADHGLAVGHHGLVGKQNMYEHSMRVPFLISGPGIAAGKKIDTPIYYQDVIPTTIESAGLDVPKHIQFKSLHPLMRGEKEHYPAIYGAYLSLQRMVRKNNWKLIHYPKVNVYRLYDLKNDPQELKDLADNPEQSLRLRSLKKALLTLQKEMNDPLQFPKKKKIQTVFE